MRTVPTILHLDMDAFYASAEQAAKPSLRGKPVVVGGLGPRGVVATASYEARRFGVHSAMPMSQARRLAPHAAYLVPRFTLYRTVSDQVMELLGRLSPLVEPLSLDEAFVDLEAGGVAHDAASARVIGEQLRTVIRAVTGLSGSVGLAGSKMLAKIASEGAKPDGLLLIEPGTERELLGPMSVRALPGVGPATEHNLRRAGTSWCGCWAGHTACRCTGWPSDTTTGPWSPSGTPSPYRSRTPSMSTCTTGCGSGRRSSGSQAGVWPGCGVPGGRGGPWCSRCGVTTSRP